MTELDAIRAGFDRQGSCGCHWSSKGHSEKCPEHGRVKVSFIMTLEELYHEYKILEAIAKSRQI